MHARPHFKKTVAAAECCQTQMGQDVSTWQQTFAGILKQTVKISGWPTRFRRNACQGGPLNGKFCGTICSMHVGNAHNESLCRPARHVAELPLDTLRGRCELVQYDWWWINQIVIRSCGNIRLQASLNRAPLLLQEANSREPFSRPTR